MRSILLYGVLLWIFGYVFGILLFSFVPNELIGWVIMPVGSAATGESF